MSTEECCSHVCVFAHVHSHFTVKINFPLTKYSTVRLAGLAERDWRD